MNARDSIDRFALIEMGYESEMIHMDDLPQYMADGAELIGIYERIAWYTFGHAPADETVAECIAECVHAVMVPILCFWTGAKVVGIAQTTDAYGAVCEEMGYSGTGWADGYASDNHCDTVSENLSGEFTYGICANLPEPLMTDDNPDAGVWSLFAKVSHDWRVSRVGFSTGQVRECANCGEREACWDDEEYAPSACYRKEGV